MHMRTNDSDLEEDRVRLTGNRYASLSDVDREVQSPRPAVRRRLVLFPNAKLIQRQTTVTSGIQTRRASRGCPTWKLMMLWNPQLSKIQSQWDRVRAPGGVFASLDAAHLTDNFEHRARVMRSVPHVMRGAMRSAISDQSCSAGDPDRSGHRAMSGRSEHGSCSCYCPGCFLFRPPRGGVVPKKQLEARIRMFQEEPWLQFLNDSSICAERSPSAIRQAKATWGW